MHDDDLASAAKTQISHKLFDAAVKLSDTWPVLDRLAELPSEQDVADELSTLVRRCGTPIGQRTNLLAIFT